MFDGGRTIVHNKDPQGLPAIVTDRLKAMVEAKFQENKYFTIIDRLHSFFVNFMNFNMNECSLYILKFLYSSICSSILALILLATIQVFIAYINESCFNLHSFILEVTVNLGSTKPRPFTDSAAV